MTMTQLRKLKRTIKPVIKKTLLKQSVLTTRLRMQNRLVDKMADQAKMSIKRRRKQLAQSSMRTFPSKQTILNHQNKHLADNVGKKLLGLARQKLHSRQQVPSDIGSIQVLMSDNVFDDIVNKLPTYEKYISPDQAKLVHKIAQLRHDLQMIKQKMQAEVQKHGTLDGPVPQKLGELAKQYGIYKTFKQMMKRSRDYVPLDIQQVESVDDCDYNAIIFDQAKRPKYPRSFFKKLRDMQLHKVMQKYVGHGGYDIGGILDQCWQNEPQVVDNVVNDTVYKYLKPLGIEDEQQVDRIKCRVVKKMRKGE